ncbi:MAG: SRPBCC family protein [Phycisphaera sp.]|nr:SRPBCC family protein [Phycisphaera sp.]
MSDTFHVEPRGDLEIYITRGFDAPRELVWKAMTTPELVRRWLYAPEGWEMTVCEGEIKVGGRYRWAWNGPDGKPALEISGENTVVEPPAKLVHTEAMKMWGPGFPKEGMNLGELLATMTLTEEDGRTTMEMVLAFASKEARDGALASGMAQGMSAGYLNLDAMLEEDAL